MLILLLLFFAASLATSCNKNDAKIYKTLKDRFPHLMRTFGGLLVGPSRFSQTVQTEVGLSLACSNCFAEAYQCGKSNCKMSCWYEGFLCDQCLHRYECIENCNKCTGFKQ